MHDERASDKRCNSAPVDGVDMSSQSSPEVNGEHRKSPSAVFEDCALFRAMLPIHDAVRISLRFYAGRRRNFLCKRHVNSGPSNAPIPIEHHASPQA